MIHYEVVGENEPALVFVHGWSCDRSYWREQVEEFAETYQVALIDMGGHGGSGLDRENWTIESFGSDVAAVVSKLNPDRAVLIGHSMGGEVNLEAARQLPDRIIGLIGVDTYHTFEMVYTQEQVEEWTTPFKDDFGTGMDGLVRGFFPENADSALVNWVVADMSSAPPEVAISALENYVDVYPADMLKEIRLPIRSINSDLWPTDLESNRKHAASFELKLMPGIGHFVQLEDPTTFNRLLHETLDEMTGKSSIHGDEE
jgi:pimeloyl-ACP methyl ester carboxylesterase